MKTLATAMSCGARLKGLSAKARRQMPRKIRSRVTGVALEWHQLRYLILEARRPMRESASPKLDASRCPLSLDYPVLSARQSGPRSRKASAGLGLGPNS